MFPSNFSGRQVEVDADSSSTLNCWRCIYSLQTVCVTSPVAFCALGAGLAMLLARAPTTWQVQEVTKKPCTVCGDHLHCKTQIQQRLCDLNFKCGCKNRQEHVRERAQMSMPIRALPTIDRNGLEEYVFVLIPVPSAPIPFAPSMGFGGAHLSPDDLQRLPAVISARRHIKDSGNFSLAANLDCSLEARSAMEIS